MPPDERAAKGVFLAFQYPVEIPGVATMNFLRTALNAQRKARGETELSTPDFLKKVRAVAARLNIPQDMLRRGVNVGFSGGEKKRNEVLQMALFEPKLCILDEMDFGLDIDALRIAADGVNALRWKDRAIVVITHYQRLLNYIMPGRRARDVEGQGGEERWQGACVGTRGQRLRPVRRAGGVEHDPEKWIPVFRKDHARSRRLEHFVMDAVVKINAVERALADQFGEAAPALPGGAAVAGIRARAFETFERQGLPHRRIEEWKYTDLRTLIREAYAPAIAPDKAALQRAAKALKAHGLDDTRKLVLVDGVFQPDLSDLARLEGGLSIEPLGAALAKEAGPAASRSD